MSRFKQMQVRMELPLIVDGFDYVPICYSNHRAKRKECRRCDHGDSCELETVCDENEKLPSCYSPYAANYNESKKKCRSCEYAEACKIKPIEFKPTCPECSSYNLSFSELGQGTFAYACHNCRLAWLEQVGSLLPSSLEEEETEKVDYPEQSEMWRSNRRILKDYRFL